VIGLKFGFDALAPCHGDRVETIASCERARLARFGCPVCMPSGDRFGCYLYCVRKWQALVIGDHAGDGKSGGDTKQDRDHVVSLVLISLYITL